MQRFQPTHWLILACALFLVLGAATPLSAQYFGQNKVRHKQLNFAVLKTEHFDIYYYPAEQEAAREVGRMAERWYSRLTKIFNHVLTSRQPVVLYATHTDFEQTSIIPGFIPAATGGVTIAREREVVIPLAGPLEDTDHVLGHELVHAFQYDIAPPGRPNGGVARLPLWFIEGMAEYLSIGPHDPFTAMWLRDAALHDKLPTIQDLDDPNKYFPYRFGEAFWAYVGARYGDRAVGQMMIAAGQSGSPAAAIKSVLHTTGKELSAAWKAAILAAVDPVLKVTSPLQSSHIVVSDKPRGLGGQPQLNVSPAISPDGKWVMFFSQRDPLSVDLYLADAETGKVVRRITSTAVSAHYNNLEFINSAGAWSRAPIDGSERFAFGHVEGGKARISIYDLRQNRVVKKFTIPGVGEVFSPTWSPDGKRIAFSAIAGGFTNLYLLDLETGKVRQLTSDLYAELQPAWSPDGREIAFATDRFDTSLPELSYGHFQIAAMDVSSGTVRPLVAPDGGDEINPQWSPDGRTIYFRSNAAGIPNLYRASLASGAEAAAAPVPLTNLQTGISGITALSPSISVAATSGEIVYSAFNDGGYELVRLAPQAPAVNLQAVAALDPGMLPPRKAPGGEVAAYLGQPRQGLAPALDFTTARYHPTLKLVGIAPPSIAVGVSSFGTGLGGGTALQFADLLNYHTLTMTFETFTMSGGTGIVKNISAQAVYLNEHHRWTYGIGGGQVPLVSAGVSSAAGTVNGQPVYAERITNFWELDRNVVGILRYPFSRAQRLEFNAGYENIGFAAQAETSFFDPLTGSLIGRQEEKLPAPSGLNFGIADAALVYDTSVFGGTSPVMGQSYRLQVGVKAGSIDFGTALIDYRKYLRVAGPITLAGRFLNYDRFGSGADNPRIQPLFLGYPSLVRGYDPNSISTAECGPNFGACPIFDRMLGSKLAVVNAEARFELFGPLGLFPVRYVPPVELAPFFDAGVAWTSLEKPKLFNGPRSGISSEGLTLRVNLLGFAVGSISLAYPNNRPGVGHVWEFSLLPGF